MHDEERLLAFSRALTDAARGGLSMAVALRELGKERAAESVSAGKTLHEALSADGPFPPLFLALLRAGEESGKTDAFLERFSAWLEVRIDFRRRLTRVFAYPAFVCCVAFLLFIVFSAKAAPLLLQPLIDVGAPLPEAAVIVTSLGAFLLENLHLLLGALVVLVLALRAFVRSWTGRRLSALAGHWLPGARYALAEARYHRLASTLELLLAAGLRPRQMMEIVLQLSDDDPVDRRRLERAAAGLRDGRTFTQSLGACFPEEDLPLLDTGEKSGRLDGALGKLAKAHHERHVHRLKLLATGVQLGATVALAPVCFALVMWIIWPAFSLLSDPRTTLNAAAAPIPQEQPASRATTADARFNERQARDVLDYMRAHDPGGKKPVPPSKLKPMGSFKKIQPTRIRSGLEP